MTLRGDSFFFAIEKESLDRSAIARSGFALARRVPRKAQVGRKITDDALRRCPHNWVFYEHCNETCRKTCLWSPRKAVRSRFFSYRSTSYFSKSWCWFNECLFTVNLNGKSGYASTWKRVLRCLFIRNKTSVPQLTSEQLRTRPTAMKIHISLAMGRKNRA